MYDHIAEGYDELHRVEQLNKLAIIGEHLDIKKEDRLLDVGCGTGFSLDYFGCSTVGIEPSEQMAAQSHHHILIGRAEELPFADDSFDIVISVTAIHNFTDVIKGLKEMRRVGKDRYAFSVLKKAKRFDLIEKHIQKLFVVEKQIEETHDMVYFCSVNRI